MATLQTYRRRFGEQPEFAAIIGKTGAQASPPSGSYVGTPNQTNAQRQVVSSDLADLGISSSTVDTDPSYYEGGYIYIPSTPEQRRVVENGYTAGADASTVLDAGTTTKVGYFTVGRNFSQTLAPNTVFEYHPLLPVVTTDHLPGIHTLINRALRSMRMVQRITFTGNGGNRYSLANYSWITSHKQIGPAWSPETQDNTEPDLLPGGVTWRYDGETLYLITGYSWSSAQTFSVDFYRHRGSWIKVGSTWADSTVGLVNETDEATAPVDELVMVARYFACHALARHGGESDRAWWAAERDRMAEIAAPYMKFDQPEHVVDRGFWHDRYPDKATNLLWGNSSVRSWP